MSRILFVLVAIAPSVAIAHVGPHDPDPTDLLLQAISRADHLLALVAAMTLPAVALLIRRARK